MPIKALECPHCTAPIPPDSGKSAVCAYCKRVLVGLPRTWWARPVDVPPWEGRPEDRGAPRVGLGDHDWVLGRRLGEGTHSEVFRAHRDARLTERVVIKIARETPEAAAALKRELRTLTRLRSSGAPGAAHFGELLPRPVAHGALRNGPAKAFAAAYRWRPGFVHTLAEVRRQHPKGVEPRVGVWMLKRLLEQLAWVHGAGFVHGAVAPEHALVHPRDHGVVLVGWSSARWRFGRDTDAPSPRVDLAAAARVAAQVLGGDGSGLPRAVPTELARWLLARTDAASTKQDAWTLREELVELSASCLGPPRHSPLALDEG